MKTVYTLYLCNGEKSCNWSRGCIKNAPENGSTKEILCHCRHTPDPEYAKNKPVPEDPEKDVNFKKMEFDDEIYYFEKGPEDND